MLFVMEGRITKWLGILRYWSFQADVVAVSVGAALAIRSISEQFVIFYIVMLLGAFSMNALGNILNDIFDFRHGVDKKGDENIMKRGHPLATGLESERGLVVAAVITLVVALACGIYIAVLRGPVILIMGFLGAIGAFFYTAGRHNLKSFGLGELLMFLIFGPMIVCTACYIESGVFSYTSLAGSFPVGLGVATIMFSNNIRDLKSDRAAGIRTLAVRLGAERARYLFTVFLMLLYAMVLAFSVLGILPIASLIVFASVFSAASTRKRIIGGTVPHDSAAITTRFFMLFGILLALGIAL